MLKLLKSDNIKNKEIVNKLITERQENYNRRRPRISQWEEDIK